MFEIKSSCYGPLKLRSSLLSSVEPVKRFNRFDAVQTLDLSFRGPWKPLFEVSGKHGVCKALVRDQILIPNSIPR